MSEEIIPMQNYFSSQSFSVLERNFFTRLDVWEKTRDFNRVFLYTVKKIFNVHKFYMSNFFEHNLV